MIVKVCCLLMFGALVSAVSHEEAWNDFMAHHPMVFSSEEESQQRKTNFFAAHDIIEEHNKKSNKTYKLEHNKFSLMSNDEKKAYLGDSSHPHHRNHSRSSSVMMIDRALPTSVDWRGDKCMQPIKDQAGCGSCWAFAAVAQVEFGHCVKVGSALALSEQQLVDCATNNYGCSGGSKYDALKYIAKTGGIAKATAYPYTSGSTRKAGTCRYSAANKGAVVSATAPATYITAGDINGIMTVLASKGLVTVSMNVVNSFYSYKSGVYAESNCNTNVLGRHAIVIVGYGTLNGVNYWVIRNSWGTRWGVSGYILFKRGVNLCTVEDLPVKTTVIG